MFRTALQIYHFFSKVVHCELIFFPLAFGGLMPVSELAKMMLVQVVLKTLYEVIVLPVTVRVVKYIKRVDDTDVYDEHISYNVLRIKEI